MRKIAFLFMFLVLVTMVHAELTEIKKEITVEIEDNILTVTGDGLDYEKDLEFDDNETVKPFNKDTLMSFIEDIECVTDVFQNANMDTFSSDISDIKDKIAGIESDLNYFDLYTECKSKQDELTTFQNQNADCPGELTSCKADLDSKTTLLTNIQNSQNRDGDELKVCEGSLNDIKTQRTFLIIGGLIAVACAVYFWRNKKGRSGGNDPHEEDPRSYM